MELNAYHQTLPEPMAIETSGGARRGERHKQIRIHHPEYAHH
jgi:hypothetical protein